MKKNLPLLGLLAISSLFFQSCATIFGGSHYYAQVEVKNHPLATIKYNGITRGTGTAIFRVKRSNANNLSITVKEDNCPEYTAKFESRTFRGWAFAGTIIGWTGTTGGVPLPWGVMVDCADGAIWKPDVNEKGVSKSDYKHFNYEIDYEGCNVSNNSKSIPYKSKSERLKEFKDLLDKGIITQTEFDAEKKKILDGE